MLFLLLSFIISLSETAGKVTTLTMENWDTLIEKRSSESVWMVMFTSESCPACKMTYPIFQKAAIESDGMVSFGTVRTDLEEGLRMKYNIQYLPTFLIFSKDGKSEYSGKRNERSFVNTAAKFIPDKTVQVESSWKKDGIDSVILFTDKDKTPPIWAAISCEFQGKIRVGITSEPDLSALYEIDKKPAIVLINQTHKIIYSGKLSFLSLHQTIVDFMHKEYVEPFQFNTEFYLPEEYSEECNEFTGYCVIHAVPDLDPKMRSAHEKFKSNRLKFFYGDEDLPFGFIKKGDIFIFAPHRHSVMKVDSPNELIVSISSIFDGSAKWESLDYYNK